MRLAPFLTFCTCWKATVTAAARADCELIRSERSLRPTDGSTQQYDDPRVISEAGCDCRQPRR